MNISRPIRTWAIFALACLCAVFAIFGNNYFLYLTALICVYAVASLGLGIIQGLCKTTSIGHGLFFAIGAYGFALMKDFPLLGGWAALPVIICLGACLGAGLGWLTNRLTGAQFALASLCWATIGYQLIVEIKALTGGFGGMSTISEGSKSSGISPGAMFVVAGLILAVAATAISNLHRSPWGRAFAALGDDPLALESVGLSRRHLTVSAMTLSAAIVALAGWLFAPLARYIGPENFSPQLSITLLLMTIFGGARHPLGAIIGSAAVIGLPELANDYSDFRLILYGGILLATVFFFPNGVTGGLRLYTITRTLSAGNDAGHIGEPVRPSTLGFEDISVNYGGNTALAGATGEIAGGNITCLVGGNGAGKTTLLNALSGFGPPHDGDVNIDGLRIAGSTPHNCSRAGIARTFQTPRPFASLAIWEGVAVGLAGAKLGSIFSAFTMGGSRMKAEAQFHQEAATMLGRMSFRGDLDAKPAALTYAEWRTADLARSVAAKSKFLLLDEPTAGLDSQEIDALERTLHGLRTQGMAILLVSHDMNFVLENAVQIIVLEAGKVAYSGPPSKETLEKYIGKFAL